MGEMSARRPTRSWSLLPELGGWGSPNECVDPAFGSGLTVVVVSRAFRWSERRKGGGFRARMGPVMDHTMRSC